VAPLGRKIEGERGAIISGTIAALQQSVRLTGCSSRLQLPLNAVLDYFSTQRIECLSRTYNQRQQVGRTASLLDR
jgi:hypothetical protein